MQIKIIHPLSVNCLLKKGQKVDFNTAYLEKNNYFDIQIPVAKKLGITSNHIFRYLKKFVGEKVKKGEILAYKKGIFNDKKIISEQDGVIKEIDHEKGIITILIKKEESDIIKAYFKGEVLEINDGEVLLEVKKGEKFPLKNVKNNFGGEVFYFEDKNSSLLSNQLFNKILVSQEINSYLQSKMETLGVLGFILLKQLPENSEINFAQLKNIDDFQKILKLHFPYCLISKESSTIYFYQ